MLLQAKLLRVLQERKVRPIGTSKEIEVDVRVIAATHCNLMQQIKDGGFRADLFYRLNVFPITLPPLRARKSDIIPLAEH
ncbi:sigma 54-interacting transcriptional regulator, partial [Escherichia coli]|nr:sigma 54-interacting transcriptional regulator [Escherichia coli]